MKKLQKDPFGDGYIIWDEEDILGGCSKWMENLLLILFLIPACAFVVLLII